MNEMIPGRTKMNFTLRVLSHPVVYLREMHLGTDGLPNAGSLLDVGLYVCYVLS